MLDAIIRVLTTPCVGLSVLLTVLAVLRLIEWQERKKQLAALENAKIDEYFELMFDDMDDCTVAEPGAETGRGNGER